LLACFGSSEPPSGLTVGNRAAELGHLEAQVRENRTHHLVKAAMALANCFNAGAEDVIMGYNYVQNSHKLTLRYGENIGTFVFLINRSVKNL
jgi:hypothetical protein